MKFGIFGYDSLAKRERYPQSSKKCGVGGKFKRGNEQKLYESFPFAWQQIMFEIHSIYRGEQCLNCHNFAIVAK